MMATTEDEDIISSCGGASSATNRRHQDHRRPQTSSSSSKSYYGKIKSGSKRPLFSSRHHNGNPVGLTHDLWANDLLLWWLPTHKRTHWIKFISILTLLVFGAVNYALQWQEKQQLQQLGQPNAISIATASSTLDLFWVIIFVLAIPSWVYWYYHLTLYGLNKPWMDPSIQAINRMDMHVPLRYYDNLYMARRGACLPQLVTRKDYNMITPNILLLDDLKNWKFHLFSTVEDAIEAVKLDTDRANNNNNNSKRRQDRDYWAPITVPGCWMLQGFNDIPIYTNQKYPFPCRPPVVPHQNPTGVYKLGLKLPEDWRFDDSPKDHDDVFSVLLHGIESACYVYCNGRILGFFKDSRLPSEFQLPRTCLDQPKIVFHFVVLRWSDGSYMEDQDHWWMAGIHRSVELIRRKRGADIMNYEVSALASGQLTVQVQLQGLSSHNGTRILKGRLYDDVQLSADGSRWEPKQEIWSQTLHIEAESLPAPSSPEENLVIRLQGNVDNIKTWSAETPTLYSLVLELLDHNGKTTQIESCRIGFRTIDANDGTLNVNGRRITVCGINRHEHDPDFGKVVSLERMHQDIKVLKQNNFNAVRTSHYPTHSSFYRLCDFYGMYVCDEANIETHGMKPMGRLAHDWGWKAAFVSRVRRMVLRDWNHPCIIAWSLGNEAGRGRNMIEARESLLALDTSRPICYESGGSWGEGTGRTELTDIVCTMYPDVNTTMKLAKRVDEDRPVILCEYSHSMNNSNGNLHLYWERIWDPTLPRLQGGFIWDMIDQGLRKKTADGRDYFAYGGDFGDSINDRQFCINGMFSPEREPHPSVAEIKYLQQPVDLSIADNKDLIELDLEENTDLIFSFFEPNKISHVFLKVQNRYVFSELDNISWRWYLHCSRSRSFLAKGAAYIFKNFLELNLHSALDRLREFQARYSDVGCEYFLKIEGALNSDVSWAEEGHVVVLKQFPVRLNFEVSVDEEPEESCADGCLPPLRVLSSINKIKIASGDSAPFLVIDKSTGSMTSMKGKSKEMLSGQGLRASFTRATTDNDRGGMELVLDFLLLSWAKSLVQLVEDSRFSYEMHWKEMGISQDLPPTTLCYETLVSDETNGESIEIETHSIAQTRDGKHILKQVIKYKAFKNGSVRLTHHITPSQALRKIPSLPRIGLSLQVDASLQKITYFGRGPHENYPDRKSGAFLGVWKTSPSEMGYDYIVPSENGNRSDCEWIVFDSGGQGGLIVADDSRTKFNFSALLHSVAEMHDAQHTCDLDNSSENEKTPIHVNVDHKIMGVGGDVSWFPCVYPEFRVPPKEYSYSTLFASRQLGTAAID